MSKIFKALDAVTADGVGPILDLQGLATSLSLYVTGTGLEPAMGGAIVPQVSVDGVTWAYIANPTPHLLSMGMTLDEVAGNIGSGPFDSRVQSSLSGAPQFFRYVRVGLYGLSGGTSPTVTAHVAVGDIEPIF